jgi:hypothetical protein
MDSDNANTKGCDIRVVKACLAEANAIERQLTPTKKARIDFDSQHGTTTPAVGTREASETEPTEEPIIPQSIAFEE